MATIRNATRSADSPSIERISCVNIISFGSFNGILSVEIVEVCNHVFV